MQGGRGALFVGLYTVVLNLYWIFIGGGRRLVEQSLFYEQVEFSQFLFFSFVYNVQFLVQGLVVQGFQELRGSFVLVINVFVRFKGGAGEVDYVAVQLGGVGFVVQFFRDNRLVGVEQEKFIGWFLNQVCSIFNFRVGLKYNCLDFFRWLWVSLGICILS